MGIYEVLNIIIILVSVALVIFSIVIKNKEHKKDANYKVQLKQTIEYVAPKNGGKKVANVLSAIKGKNINIEYKAEYSLKEK